MAATGRITSTTLGKHYVRGLLMGAADVVPGVSGGTVALVVGIYIRLVGCLRLVAGVPIVLLRRGPGAARARLREVDWAFLLPLGAGIGTALVVGAQFIPDLLERYPQHARGLFFGLIAASLPVPWRRMADTGRNAVAIAVTAAVVAFVLVGLPPRAVTEPALAVVFASAAVGICAMILPGVSGAFLLLVMGVYEPTLHAVDQFDVTYIAVFCLGAALGLGVFARLLTSLLARHHDRTMAALVGLMAGALRALWPWLDADRRLRAPPGEWQTVAVVALAVVGFVAVTILLRRAAPREVTAG